MIDFFYKFLLKKLWFSFHIVVFYLLTLWNLSLFPLSSVWPSLSKLINYGVRSWKLYLLLSHTSWLLTLCFCVTTVLPSFIKVENCLKFLWKKNIHNAVPSHVNKLEKCANILWQHLVKGWSDILLPTTPEKMINPMGLPTAVELTCYSSILLCMCIIRDILEDVYIFNCLGLP